MSTLAFLLPRIFKKFGWIWMNCHYRGVQFCRSCRLYQWFRLFIRNKHISCCEGLWLCIKSHIHSFKCNISQCETNSTLTVEWPLVVFNKTSSPDDFKLWVISTALHSSSEEATIFSWSGTASVHVLWCEKGGRRRGLKKREKCRRKH